MGNARAVIHRRSAIERSADALDQFMQKNPNHFIWIAGVFIAVSLIFLVSTRLGGPGDAPPSDSSNAASLEALQVIVPESDTSSESDQTTIAGQDPAVVKDLAQARNVRRTEVKPGDSLGKILGGQGFTPSEIHEIAKVIEEADGHVTIFPGEVFEFFTDASGTITHFSTETPQHETLSVRRTETGFSFDLTTKPTQMEQNFKAGSIHNSLFADASKAGLSDKVIMELAQLFQWQVDFALDIRQGDSFKVIYNDIFIDGQKLRSGPILAAEFTNNNKVLRGFRYEHADGTIGYYNEQGESLKKAYLKAPVDFARISSRFSLARKHPVLHKIRAHKGVDYAAPRGTPIKSTGRGRITFAGWKGGYGRTVIVQHNEKHSTLYAHMNNFAKGLKVGQRVNQGQVIGTIGSTGLATGPHLHYEFRLNGTQVDPLKVKSPQAPSLAGADKQKFLQQISQHRAALTTGDTSDLAANATEEGDATPEL